MKTFERETKFRGKCLRKGEWWEGYYIYSGYDDKHYISSNAIIHGNLNQFVGLAHFAEVDPETVGQFTGLKDKNGKDIYEGDPVKIDGKLFNDRKPRLSKMIWNESCYGWRLSLQSEIMIKSKHLEIIGNIHQNPELL